MKLYAVTKGCYSDYHIVALTADKSRAKRIAKIYSDNWGEARVEEYEDGDSGDFRVPYYVLFYKNGSISAFMREYEDFRKAERKTVYHYGSNPMGTVKCEVYVLAESEEQAIKIAIDYLTQLKAEKEGI